jgi:hypothetical protein
VEYLVIYTHALRQNSEGLIHFVGLAVAKEASTSADFQLILLREVISLYRTVFLAIYSSRF